MTVSAPGGPQSLPFFFQEGFECEVMSTSTPDTALLLASSADQVDYHWGEFFRVIWGDNHDNHLVNTSNNTTIKLTHEQ